MRSAHRFYWQHSIDAGAAIVYYAALAVGDCRLKTLASECTRSSRCGRAAGIVLASTYASFNYRRAHVLTANALHLHVNSLKSIARDWVMIAEMAFENIKSGNLKKTVTMHNSLTRAACNFNMWRTHMQRNAANGQYLRR